MLEIVGDRYRNCDGITRREALRVGALALGGLTLSHFFRTRARAQGDGGGRDTAVIQIFMGGGPSHLDMYDLKPDAPAEIRGEFREIPTRVPGIRISEHLPLQAAVMDKLAIVRSVTHHNSSHLPSSHFVLTGHLPTTEVPNNANPSTASVVAKLRGPNVPGMPAYVAVPRRTSYGGAAYLGGAYDAFPTQKDPNSDGFSVPNLTRLPELSMDRLVNRRALTQELDRLRRDVDARGEMAALDRYSAQALELVTSEKVERAFDIRREPPRVRDWYGRTPIGQNCLLARRLIEAGVTYVTCLSGGGWDTHVNNFSELKNVTLPRYDRAVAALVSDLYERGLGERVLVMAFGEFGRTPRINRDAGRDHWPGAMSVLFSGGGLKVGQVVGSTDSQGAYPASKPYSPGCVLATMYHVMGVDYHYNFHDQSDRPIPVLPEGRPIAELI
jgi:hypothetical protein